MAFALQFDGVDDRVDIGTTVSSFDGTGSDAYVEFELKNTGSTGFLRVCSDQVVSGGTNRIIINTNGTEIRLGRLGINYIWTGLSFDMDAAFVKFKIATVYGSTNKELFINDVSQGQQSAASGSHTIGGYTHLGVDFNTWSDFQLKYFRLVDNGSTTTDQDYDADTSGGTGNVLPEITANFSDGTLVSFPTDDSQWISLGGADNTGTLAATESTTDTMSSSGLVAIEGSAPIVESSADTTAISGTVTSNAVTGDLAATESSADTSGISGIVVVTGSAAVSESSSDTLSSSGVVSVVGALAANESSVDTFVAIGLDLPKIDGQLSYVLSTNGATVSMYFGGQDYYVA